MKTLITPIIYVLAFVLLNACSPESSEVRAVKPLQQAPKPFIPQYGKIQDQTFQWISEDGGQSQLEFNPQVDILFVSDNSDSMKSAQENLVHNIGQFTSGMIKNKMIDYHIGVISCWDSSERYAKTKNNAYNIGDLQFAKTAQGQSTSKRFIEKADSGSASLAQTLNIGVASYKLGGPEVEEFFSPLAAAIEQTGHGASNENFFRPEAQLVVILLTDADDSTSRMSPEQMAKMLVEFKGGKANKVSAYGVLVRAQDADIYKDWDLRIHPKYHPECFDMTSKTPKNNGQCKGFAPERLEQFIVAANHDAGTPSQTHNKYIMSITAKNFGSELGKIGEDITVKTLQKEIFLTQRPRVDKSGQLMVRVKYGTDKQIAAGKAQAIEKKQNGGWLYDPENNSIVISGQVHYEYQEGAHFAVDLIPLTLKQ